MSTKKMKAPIPATKWEWFGIAAHFMPSEKGRQETQLEQVFALMSDGKWRTLGDIQKQLPQHYETQSISARLRDLRKAGWDVPKMQIFTGIWIYQVKAKVVIQ